MAPLLFGALALSLIGVARTNAEKFGIGQKKRASGAKARSILDPFTARLKVVP
jgi:hypothetical protein